MPELNPNLQIHIAVGVWTSFADGEALLIELSKIVEVLSDHVDTLDKHEAKDLVQFWFNKFQSNFEKAESDMIAMIDKSTHKSELHRSLIDLAQRIVVTDEVLKDQEDVAIAIINSWF